MTQSAFVKELEAAVMFFGVRRQRSSRSLSDTTSFLRYATVAASSLVAFPSSFCSQVNGNKEVIKTRDKRHWLLKPGRVACEPLGLAKQLLLPASCTRSSSTVSRDESTRDYAFSRNSERYNGASSFACFMSSACWFLSSLGGGVVRVATRTPSS